MKITPLCQAAAAAAGNGGLLGSGLYLLIYSYRIHSAAREQERLEKTQRLQRRQYCALMTMMMMSTSMAMR